MGDIDPPFMALSKSAFRSKFHLQDNKLLYLQTKRLPVILEHARDFIAKRLAPAAAQNDGKQTPSSSFKRIIFSPMRVLSAFFTFSEQMSPS